MSNLNNREVYKKAEKLKEEIPNSNSILDFNSEEEQESIENIKKKWRKKQIKKFKQIQHKQSEKKQIKKVVSGLTFGAILFVIIPFIPTVTSLIFGSSPENNRADTNLTEETEGINNLTNTLPKSDDKNSLGTLFKNLKTIKEKQKEHNRQLQKVIDMSDGKKVSPGEE